MAHAPRFPIELAVVAILAGTCTTLSCRREEPRCRTIDAQTARPSAKEPALGTSPSSAHDPAAAEPLPSASASAALHPTLETLEVPGDLPALVVRGQGRERMVFLHAACWQGRGHAQAFEQAAANHGLLLVLAGDVACEEAHRTWSLNAQRTHQRIKAALKAAGQDEAAGDVILIGYSLGATMAERLVTRWPDDYTRVILIAGPEIPAERNFDHAKAVVTIACERDRHDLMMQGADRLQKAGIRAKFMILPAAAHGWMGPQAEPVMAEALDWLGQPANP